jgi:hypothetical protein
MIQRLWLVETGRSQITYLLGEEVLLMRITKFCKMEICLYCPQLAQWATAIGSHHENSCRRSKYHEKPASHLHLLILRISQYLVQIQMLS